MRARTPVTVLTAVPVVTASNARSDADVDDLVRVDAWIDLVWITVLAHARRPLLEELARVTTGHRRRGARSAATLSDSCDARRARRATRGEPESSRHDDGEYTRSLVRQRAVTFLRVRVMPRTRWNANARWKYVVAGLHLRGDSRRTRIDTDGL